MAINDRGKETFLSATQAQFVQLQQDGSINVDFGDDKTLEGEVWNFKLKAISTLSIQESGNIAEYEFSMSLVDGCVNDELSLPSTIDDFNYYISYTGEHII